MKKKQLIRLRFRDSVFQRDNYTCLGCGIKMKEFELDAHHITDRNEMPNGGYVKENGATLCKESCHLKAELYHTSGGTEHVEGLHPDDLYAKIGSSKEKAVEASRRLK